MPTVEVNRESYESLKQLADARGSSVQALVQLAVDDLVRRQQSTPDDWLQRWRELQATIQARIPEGLTADEIEADIDAAVAEVRNERRARSG
jgi:hypothetical protein